LEKRKAETKEQPRVIELPRFVTVKQLAANLEVEPVRVVKQLMRKGVMANLNQAIDFETASSVATDFGYTTKATVENRGAAPAREEALKGTLVARPPVVTVMGHVDHGKTTLLDAIRETDVAAREAGAITQHIGAYQTVVDGRKITFLDTPGHEAFTAMRSHGARATDIVVLVVAADDGVMPQTEEAVNHARAADVPILVANNKTDKAAANPDRVKQQLADLGLVVEEWGGDTLCVPVSAKKREGISDLLESVFLVAELLELKADSACPAQGVVIEAELDKSKGPLATLLVQKGTLKIGDVVVVGDTWGKVKAMFDDKGKSTRKAEPSTPVEVLGINEVPKSGDLFQVVASEQKARGVAAQRRPEKARSPLSLSTLSSQISTGQIKELTVVLKTDVDGSIDPIRVSLERLSHEKAKARVIHAASGGITESDVLLASASNGIIIGFNSRPTPGAAVLANTEGVVIQEYDVIYKLIEDVDKTLKGMLEPTYADVLSGRAEVRAVFPSGKFEKVAGVYVTDGRVWRDATVKVLRQGKIIAESRVSSLKRFKKDASEVTSGLECGLGVSGFSDFEAGDVIELYSREKVT